eukprot:gene2582-5498_t
MDTPTYIENDMDVELFEVHPAPPDVIKSRIEQIMENIFTQLAAYSSSPSNNSTNDGETLNTPSITVPVLRPYYNSIHKRYACAASFRRISLFTTRAIRVIEILKESYISILNGISRSQRDIYYGNIDLYGRSQATTDRTIILVSCMLRVPRRSLLFTTSSYGFYHGAVQILSSEGYYETKSTCETVSPIPPISDNLKINVYAKYALVVEKDAVLQGRGFPSVDTRFFVKHVAQQVPVYVLVDADPSGLESTDKYRFDVPLHARIKMSDREISLLKGIKHRECMTEAMKKEIQLLETTNYKAEIEILNSPQKPTFLVDSYLPWKLDTQVYIPL